MSWGGTCLKLWAVGKEAGPKKLGRRRNSYPTRFLLTERLVTNVGRRIVI